jgi:hypothetical protein
MKHEGKWNLIAASPLGDESYTLTLNPDGSGRVDHPKGSVTFIDAIVAPNGMVDIVANTDVPMTTDFRIMLLMADSVGIGTLHIGKFAQIPIKAERA